MTEARPHPDIKFQRRAAAAATVIRSHLDEHRGEIVSELLEAQLEDVMPRMHQLINLGFCQLPHGADWRHRAIADLRAASAALERLSGDIETWLDCHKWAAVLEAGSDGEVQR